MSDQQPKDEDGQKLRRTRNLPLIVLLSGLALVALIQFSDNLNSGTTAPITFALFEELGAAGVIEEFEIHHSMDHVEIKGKFRDKSLEDYLKGLKEDENGKVKTALKKREKFRVEGVLRNTVDDREFYRDVIEKWGIPAAKIKETKSSQLWPTLLLSIAPWLLLAAFFWFFVFRPMRQAGGAGGVLSFGRSRARMYTPEMANVTFEDVAGIEEAKEEVKEIIEFLRSPQRFQRLGGRIPRGVILVSTLR